MLPGVQKKKQVNMVNVNSSIYRLCLFKNQKKKLIPPVQALKISISQLLMYNTAMRLLTPVYLSSPKVSTVAAETCSVPSTVTLTNTTVPTTTGVQLLPAYAKRIPSWWPRKFRSYED